MASPKPRKSAQDNAWDLLGTGIIIQVIAGSLAGIAAAASSGLVLVVAGVGAWIGAAFMLVAVIAFGVRLGNRMSAEDIASSEPGLTSNPTSPGQ